MVLKFYYFFIFFLVSLPTLSFSNNFESPNFIQIKNALDFCRNEFGLAGVGIGIVVKEDAFTICSGFRDIDNHDLIDERTLFYLGSVSKGFLSLVAAKASEDYKFSLDDSLKNLISNSPFISNKTLDIPEKLTFRDLLSHKSGINHSLLFTQLYRKKSKEDLEKLLLYKVFASNEKKFLYSHPGYSLASIFLEDVTGKKIEELIKQYVFNPFGMNNTVLCNELSSKCKSYTYRDNKFIEISDVLGISDFNLFSYADDSAARYVFAPGSVCSNLLDMNKYLKILLKNKENHVPHFFFENINKFFHKETTRFNEYELGWRLEKYLDLKIYYHEGFLAGFTPYVCLVPEMELGFVLLINSDAGIFMNKIFGHWLINLFVNGDDSLDVLKNGVNHYKFIKGGEKNKHIDAIQKNLEWINNPLDEYTGIFKNEEFGGLEIFSTSNSLKVRWCDVEYPIYRNSNNEFYGWMDNTQSPAMWTCLVKYLFLRDSYNMINQVRMTSPEMNLNEVFVKRNNHTNLKKYVGEYIPENTALAKIIIFEKDNRLFGYSNINFIRELIPFAEDFFKVDDEFNTSIYFKSEKESQKKMIELSSDRVFWRYTKIN